MHDDPTLQKVERDAAYAEHTILHLMLEDPAPGLWSVQELVRAHGDADAATDAIAALHATGLIHLVAGFAWPTRAAARAVRVENCL